jgi:DNA-binding winged helix-turn-helix (wHTH) protein/predicted ATPase
VATLSSVEFPPFRLDLVNQELWRGTERLPLRAKPFAVLAYLVRNPARLVLRDELVSAIWPDTHVGDGLLRGYVRELRNVLGDDPEAPRFIETIARRGYRFVAPVLAGDDRARPGGAGVAGVVGRDGELRELAELFAEADSGVRRIAFVTGEAGIGKTTLVDAFVAALEARGVATVRGQCVEHFGGCEAYLPVLEALGRLGRSSQGPEAVRTLARHAPTWLVELPALVADADLEAVQRRAQGATRERMLRELADALEALTAERTLVLVLEDLHWSDPSTVDLLSSLARRRERARLLVLATYRPADVAGGAHPLGAVAQELRVHGLCSELALRALDAVEVAELLAARLPSELLAPGLAASIHRATEGNPLFVVNVADEWTAHGAPRAGEPGAVPDTLRQMIGRQLARLPAETRRTLEAASAIGAFFSTAALAAALEEPEDAVDARCGELAARGLFLCACGTQEGAAGALAGRYGFLHALYRQVLYGDVPATHRVRLHRRVGDWLERTAGTLAPERAAELALHFELAHEPARALHHLEIAAKNAMRRHACDEANHLLGRALDRLAALPPGEDSAARELALRMAQGGALLMTRGYAASEVRHAYARAHELSRRLPDGPALLFALAGLFRFFFVRADFKLARELSEEVLRVAERTDPALLPVAHSLVGLPLLSVAEFARSRAHFEAAVAGYDIARHGALALEHGDDPGLTALAFLAIGLWLTGHPDRALARMREAQALAERLAAPYCRAFAQSFSAWIHVRRGEAAEAEACCRVLLPLAAAQGFGFLHAEGEIFSGWALAEQGRAEEGIARIRSGLAAQRAGGAEMGRPSHLALLADACAKTKRAEEGLAAIAEALAIVAETGERTHEAELHRLKGELLAQQGERSEAEVCVRHAIDVAHGQGARSLELRAALGLVRLQRGGGDRAAAEPRRRLGELFASFDEGFATADLRAAREILAAKPPRRA